MIDNLNLIRDKHRRLLNNYKLLSRLFRMVSANESAARKIKEGMDSNEDLIDEILFNEDNNQGYTHAATLADDIIDEFLGDSDE